MRIRSTAILAVPAVILSAGAAFAHAHLLRASPAAEAGTAVMPQEVSITFSEAIEPRFSTIEVIDAAGQRVDRAPPHLDAADGARLAARRAFISDENDKRDMRVTLRFFTAWPCDATTRHR